MDTSVLIYGANGYTGALIARLAAEQGLRPVLAGRNASAVAQLAVQLGCPFRVAPLDDAGALDVALRDIAVVLHCAGPFAETARPMAEACLRARAHYLDITGEVAVFEALAGRDVQARAAGIMMMPGVGFDVVPSDCLARYLAELLPGAQQLTLAFQASGGVSWGTASTAIESLPQPSMVREKGRLVNIAAPRARSFDFGDGPVAATSIAWGDLATAFRSTGIPNIEVYAALGPAAQRLLGLTTWLRPLLASRAARTLLRRAVRLTPRGPSDAARAGGQCLLWGEVTDAAGKRRAARLRTPEAYTLTAHTALVITRRALAGDVRPGFQTPACAYGADFILQFPGVLRSDIPG